MNIWEVLNVKMCDFRRNSQGGIVFRSKKRLPYRQFFFLYEWLSVLDKMEWLYPQFRKKLNVSIRTSLIFMKWFRLALNGQFMLIGSLHIIALKLISNHYKLPFLDLDSNQHPSQPRDQNTNHSVTRRQKMVRRMVRV